MDCILKQNHIKFVRDNFENKISKNLNLTRVSSPLFLEASLGLNDQLNGIEKAVKFKIKSQDIECEINQSLAKWKRVAIDKYNFKIKFGLYTNMNAIRKDEFLDETHSIYVDQWDWEVCISNDDRNIDTLKKYAKNVYKSILQTNKMFSKKYGINNLIYLPKDIYFINSQDLEDLYPDKSPDEREYLISKKFKAIFIIGIGKKLKSGLSHGERSPDYDDWDINGDLILWNEKLGKQLEISSMGVRVNSSSLKKQLKEANNEERLSFEYHQKIIKGNLPSTIGGGIGQSRLCMIILGVKHIGEVHVSVWPKKMIENLEKRGIKLL